MEKKWLALVAASAAASAMFVGCSCGNRVDNSMDNMNQIEVQSDVTLSSAETSDVVTASAKTSTTGSVTTTSGTTSSVSEGETSSTVSRAVQFVGQPQGRTTTAKPKVVTQIVVVTVTRAPVVTTTAPPVITTTVATTTETTEAVTTTTTALVTSLMPDGIFHPDQDLNFAVETAQMSIGNIMPDIGTKVVSKTETAPVNGGAYAYVYSCNGFTVTSEMYINEDGSVQELVREIVLTGSDVCTAKGITAGSSTDDIITAYGTEGLEITETYNYRYKTEDGRVLDICTDGSIVKEIKYYTEVQ